MDISVPSRFACLNVEEEEFRPVSNRGSKKKMDSNKIPTKRTSSNIVNGKKTPGISGKNGVGTKKKGKGKQETKQWEEWKRKDDELVNDNFEEDLKCAILQSKLDFEHQKKHSNVIKTSPTDGRDQVKKKKNKTMSLDQFLDNAKVSAVNGNNNGEKVEGEANFFEKVSESAKQEITKEKVEQKRKEREVNIEEIITLAQCQEKLEKERVKNESLLGELLEARKEIALVKKRNTILCSMLSQGEMKDKAAVLLELERLSLVKEELTDEVGRLYKLLEQERSKASITSNESHNSKNKDKQKRKKN